MAVKSLSPKDFASTVSASGKPVLVDFFASWCGPCRALSPVVEQISDELADKIDVYKFDVEEGQDVALTYKVVNIPTLILFKDGAPALTLVGAAPKGKILRDIEAVL